MLSVLNFHFKHSLLEIFLEASDKYLCKTGEHSFAELIPIIAGKETIVTNRGNDFKSREEKTLQGKGMSIKIASI